MPRYSFLKCFTMATVVLTSAGPTHAFMIRPELGMGLTDYLSLLSKECPASSYGLAMTLK